MKTLIEEAIKAGWKEIYPVYVSGKPPEIVYDEKKGIAYIYTPFAINHQDLIWGRGHVKKAQKLHECYGCQAEIKKGEKYIIRSEHSLRHTSYNCCLACGIHHLAEWAVTYAYKQKEEPIMENSQEFVTQQQSVAVATNDSWLDPAMVIEQVRRVTQIRETIMKRDEHYGIIPGTQKPTLYKAGAEILGLAFNLDAQYTFIVDSLPRDHREYTVDCIIYNRATGTRLGAGTGSESTMESQHRWRYAQYTCPQCGQAAIIIDKYADKGGWVCFKKKGGCNTKFAQNEKKITRQKLGRIENPDIADTYNTARKKAKKRAYVDAILTVTASSGMFTQDWEDIIEMAKQNPIEQDEPPPPPKWKKSTKKDKAPEPEPEEEAPEEFEILDRQLVETLHRLLLDLKELAGGGYVLKLQQFEDTMKVEFPVNSKGELITNADLKERIAFYTDVVSKKVMEETAA